MNYIGASENQTGVPVGYTRTKSHGLVKENPEQCSPTEQLKEIPDELNTLRTILEDLENLTGRLIERLDPVSCHVPQPVEKMAEPPKPNKTAAGQAIRDARVRIAVVCSKLSEQLDALEL